MNEDFLYYFFLIIFVTTLLILLLLKCYYWASTMREPGQSQEDLFTSVRRVSTIREPGQSQEDLFTSVRRVSTMREPGRSQENFWSISIPETPELPSYEELQENPAKPPSYWSLYSQSVIKETL